MKNFKNQPNRKMMNPNQPIMTNLKMDELEPFVCSMCDSDVFFPAYRLSHISALQSPVGQAGMGTAQVGWVCSNCGAVNKQIRKGDKYVANEKGTETKSPFSVKVQAEGRVIKKVEPSEG